MKNILIYTITLFSFIYSHCQVPCGIFDDIHRIVEIDEHIKTINKSISNIISLSNEKEDSQNMNQLIRWINTKENHSNKIQNLVSEYFLAQRIKPVEKNDTDYDRYVELTTVCHKIIYLSMKLKQNVDSEITIQLKNNINLLVDMYFNDEQKRHLKVHRN